MIERLHAQPSSSDLVAQMGDRPGNLLVANALQVRELCVLR